jgi:hypothetical protein
MCVSDLITAQPKSACQPFLLSRDSMRTDIIEPGTLVTAKEAERRVLFLEKSAAARTLEKVTISLAPAHCPIGAAFVLESCAAGGRMAIHLRTSSAGSREIMTTFGPDQAFPDHVPPQAARVDHKVYRRKVAHNQIKIEVE